MPHATTCINCGQLTTNTTRCDNCTRKRIRNRDTDGSHYYQSKEWRNLRAQQIRRQPTCTVCGSTNRLTAHHKHNRQEGGEDTLDNLLTLCIVCHSTYEADKRAGQKTDLVRIIESL